MYTSSDEDHDEDEQEPMQPPKDLLQTARDILGHNIAMKDLLQAWDACAEHITVDARTTACMEKLMAGGEAEDREAEAPVKRAPKPRLNRGAAPAAVPLARKRSVVEVPDDSDEDESQDEEAHSVQPSTSKVAMKGKQTARRSKAADRAAARERQAKRPKLTPGRVIDLEESDDDAGDGDASIEIISSPVKKKVPPPQDGSASSSSSAGNVAFVGGQRKQSTPPTSGEDVDEDMLGDVRPAQPEGSKDKGKGKAAAEPKIEISPLAQVLAMVPDVDPSHAEGLVAQFIDYPNWIEHVVDKLFSGPSYPKAVIKPKASTSTAGASTSTGGDEASDSAAKRYMDKSRAPPSAVYIMLALEYLCDDYPRIPIPYVRQICYSNNHLYAVAYEILKQDSNMDPPPYKPLQNPRKSKGKGSQAECPELDEERSWIESKRAREIAIEDAKLAEEKRIEEEEAAGHTFECGCCFGDNVFSKMVQCPEAHLFCMDCARKNAETIMGQQKIDLQCMDQDGCPAHFTASECARFLAPKQLSLLEKLRSEKAIDSAELEGLSKCPHCPWACVIENPEEKLFRCGNEECFKVTCRKCQKSDHLPKTCEEYAADLKTNNIHKVEEAMTEALIRRCPTERCKKPILKEYGCNKMTCTACGTLFCFVCQAAIKGYDHFAGQPVQPGVVNSSSKCPLWDKDQNQRLYDDVEEARRAAIAELKAQEDVEVEDKELDKLTLDKPTQAHDPRYPVGYMLPDGRINGAAGQAQARPGAAHPHRPQPALDQINQQIAAMRAMLGHAGPAAGAGAAWNPYIAAPGGIIYPGAAQAPIPPPVIPAPAPPRRRAAAPKARRKRG